MDLWEVSFLILTLGTLFFTRSVVAMFGAMMAWGFLRSTVKWFNGED